MFFAIASANRTSRTVPRSSSLVEEAADLFDLLDLIDGAMEGFLLLDGPSLLIVPLVVMYTCYGHFR